MLFIVFWCFAAIMLSFAIHSMIMLNRDIKRLKAKEKDKRIVRAVLQKDLKNIVCSIFPEVYDVYLLSENIMLGHIDNVSFVFDDYGYVWEVDYGEYIKTKLTQTDYSEKLSKIITNRALDLYKMDVARDTVK